MSPEEMIKYLAAFGRSSKKVGGIHDNFGWGVRISLLPWNPEGVVVISVKNGKQSMLQMANENGEYEVVDWPSQSSTKCVIDPTEMNWESINEIDWGRIKPDWIQDHGTIIVLLGRFLFYLCSNILIGSRGCRYHFTPFDSYDFDSYR